MFNFWFSDVLFIKQKLIKSTLQHKNYYKMIHYKMVNLDSITNENNKEHNKKWSCIPDHSYRILIIGGSGSRKTNALLNLIKEEDDIDKIYLYRKNLS